jgi:hypothetical protein
MPECAICKHVFPPNYVEIIEKAEKVNGEYPKECVFCKLGIDKVERETSPNSGEFIEYTKTQCTEDYKKFLRRLKESQNVKAIINKSYEDFQVGGK